MLMHIFNVGVGMTFSGGLIDLFLFGILQGNAKDELAVGCGCRYPVTLLFIISCLDFNPELDLKTPGREFG